LDSDDEDSVCVQPLLEYKSTLETYKLTEPERLSLTRSRPHEAAEKRLCELTEQIIIKKGMRPCDMAAVARQKCVRLYLLDITGAIYYMHVPGQDRGHSRKDGLAGVYYSGHFYPITCENIVSSIAHSASWMWKKFEKDSELSKYDPERSRQDHKISTRAGKKRKCSKKNAADDESGASAHLTRFEKLLTNKPHEAIEVHNCFE